MAGSFTSTSTPMAKILFAKMKERTVVSWTTVISAFSNLQKTEESLMLFILMLREDVNPNMYTYSGVLRACITLPNMVGQIHSSIIKSGWKFDVFVRSALIDAYSRVGEPRSAMWIFNEDGVLDKVVWNSIVGGLAVNCDGGEALCLFKRMQRSGFAPDQATLASVLRACTGMTLLELGRQVHVHVLKYGTRTILSNALLDLYCKCGSLRDAGAVFHRMVERDVISWSTMILGMAQNGYSHDALRLFESMISSGTRPNSITIVGVLFSCSHGGFIDDGWSYFRSMKEQFGIVPGREHYNCMIDLLGRIGKLEDAASLIREMECEPDVVTWRTLLGACRVHRNADLAVLSAKKVLTLDPGDAGTYILLSNIYSNMKKWDEAEEVRRTMRNRGIVKEPGCSWIEVNKRIHAFVLGDRSHPQIHEILRELGELMQRLTSLAGYVPDVSFVLQDLEGEEQKGDSLLHHSEKIAVVFGMMSLPLEKTVRIKKNLRICGDCHVFAKLVTRIERRVIVIRDPVRYHHFTDGLCSCRDYW